MAMDEKRALIAVVVIVLVLLIAGSLLRRRSVEKEKQLAVERPRTVQEMRDKARKKEPAPFPEHAVEEEVAPIEKLESVEPVVVVPAPPPVSTADCKADSKKVVLQRVSVSPEGMVYVPGGVFNMGSSQDTGHADEGPIHKVCLNGYYIDKYEVTNAQFKEFVDATGYVTDAEKSAASEDVRTWRNPHGAESKAESVPDHPVVCVSWNDANAYAEWAGKRLPTEAEWEKASRGTDGRIYPWGNQNLTGTSANIADRSAALRWSDNSVEDNQKRTAPVGSFPDGNSPYGVEDMAGNVWEWCYDWWSKDFYSISPSQNPIGPEAGEFRVIRGGSWFYSSDGTRTTQRMHFRPAGISEAVGFRCVKGVG